MKPLLCFIGGCEFEFTIAELKTNPAKYFDFEYIYSYQHSAETNPYLFLSQYSDVVMEQKPDAVILSQHDFMKDAIAKIQLNRVKSKQDQLDHLKDLSDQAELMIMTLGKLDVPIIMQFFPWARTNMLNRFKHSGDFLNEDQFIREYVTAMEKLSANYPNFYFLNLTEVCAMHGYFRTIKPMDPPWFSHINSPATYIAQEYSHLINYVLRLKKKIKCVLVDLDNTMWKGVIRDVGVENLQVRPDRERFHWNVLSILNARGIVIGVVSKNDAYLEEQIRGFIAEHSYGIDFVCFSLNWEDKWKKILEVQQKLNIGLDSIAFIDDNAFEREQVTAMLPDLSVYDENIFEQLLYMPEFQPEFITAESNKRAGYYIQENQRQEVQSTLSREDFLKQCDFRIKVKSIDPYEINRVTELIGRTNQLNTSIKRYTQEQVISLSKDDRCDIFTVYVSDKYGDYGLVGVCIGLKQQGVFQIDTLLFSCRVMSKGVEDYTLSSILRYAREQGFETVTLPFNRGPKNSQMQTILENNNFLESFADEQSVVYSFDLSSQQIRPFDQWFSPMDEQSQQQAVLS